MEKILTVRISEDLYCLVEDIVNKLGLFKDKSEFVRFSLINTILNELKYVDFGEILEIIEKKRNKLEKEGKLLDEEEIVKIVKEERV